MDNKMIIALVSIVFILILGYLFLGNKDSGNMNTKVVKAGDIVSVHYTGKLENGTVFDSSVGKAPLTFVAMGGQMIKGFDEAVIGMKVGEKKTITIPPEEAYGTSGSHPLAGKALIFDIELVKIGG